MLAAVSDVGLPISTNKRGIEIVRMAEIIKNWSRRFIPVLAPFELEGAAGACLDGNLERA